MSALIAAPDSPSGCGVPLWVDSSHGLLEMNDRVFECSSFQVVAENVPEEQADIDMENVRIFLRYSNKQLDCARLGSLKRPSKIEPTFVELFGVSPYILTAR